MWMAPVLQGKESTDRITSLYWTVQRGMLGNLWVCQRAVWDGHKDTSCYIKGETAIVQHLVYWRKTVSKLGATDPDPHAASFIVEISCPVFTPTPQIATPTVRSPLCQAFLGEARDYNGVKRLLGARNGDAKGSVIPFQLHGVDYGA